MRQGEVGRFYLIVSTTLTFHTNYVSRLNHQNWNSIEGGDHWKPIRLVSADFVRPSFPTMHPFRSPTRLHRKSPLPDPIPVTYRACGLLVKMYKVGGIIHLYFFTDMQEEIEERESQVPTVRLAHTTTRLRTTAYDQDFCLIGYKHLVRPAIPQPLTNLPCHNKAEWVASLQGGSRCR